MNKNFKELNDYEIFADEDQKNIFARITKLDGFIDDNNLDYFGIELRKTLELVFSSHEKMNIDGSLGKKIKSLREIYHIPTNVFSAISSLKSVSNRESHEGFQKKSDRPYKVSMTIPEARISMRNLWLFIKWVAIEIQEIKSEELVDTVYFELNTQTFNANDKEFMELENSNNDMEAKRMSMSQLILTGDYKFNVPTYQRDYTWGEANISKLLKDIDDRSIDNKTHYFGSLAIAVDNDEGILRIIDGQQRITTTLLILKNFYDEFVLRKIKLPLELDDFGKDKIKKIYMNQDVLSSQVAVTSILAGITTTTDKVLPKKPFNNYALILNWLKKLTDDEIIERYSAFSTKFEIATLIFKTSIDNEMDIFENLNTGGAELSDWDLIRSYIFSRIDPKLFLENEKIIDKSIKNMFIVPMNIHTKNKSEKKISSFFTVYNRLKTIEKRGKLLENNKKYEVFKSLWPSDKQKFKSITSFNNSLKEIEKILTIYIELVFGYKSNDSKLHPYAHIISLINREDAIPLLIKSIDIYCPLDDNFKIKKVTGKFEKFLRVMETYFIRGDLFGNNLSDYFDGYILKEGGDFIDDLYTYLKKSPIPMGSMDEFIEKISVSTELKPGNIMNILTNLEFHLRGIKLGSSGYITFEKTHEHIIAQKLKYIDYDDKKITKEEYDDLQLNKKNLLGNALILSLGNNAKAGNKKFIDKLNIYREHSKLALGDEKKVISSLITRKYFTFGDAVKRSKEMAKYIKNNKLYYEE